MTSAELGFEHNEEDGPAKKTNVHGRKIDEEEDFEGILTFTLSSILWQCQPGVILELRLSSVAWHTLADSPYKWRLVSLDFVGIERV